MSISYDAATGAFCEYVEHACNAFCTPVDEIHADVLWSHEADLGAVETWLLSLFGTETVVSVERASEAPPMEVLVAGGAHFAELNDRPMTLPLAAFHYAYVFRWRGVTVVEAGS